MATLTRNGNGDYVRALEDRPDLRRAVRDVVVPAAGHSVLADGLYHLANAAAASTTADTAAGAHPAVVSIAASRPAGRPAVRAASWVACQCSKARTSSGRL